MLVLSTLFVLQARGRHIAAMLIGGALVAELWTATDGWNPVLPADAMYPTTPLIEKLQRLQDATPRNAPFRIVGIGAALFPNAQAMYGFADIRTHDPMAFGRYLGVLRLLTNLETNEYFAKWSERRDAAAQLSQRALHGRRPRSRSRRSARAISSSTTAATAAFSRTAT